MDLLQTQIKESCSLALPEGLKDLISDISREVLRAQPDNIPQFIADYLEVLLEVREKLSIASHITNDTCKNVCELYKDFKAIGLNEEDIEMATKIVEKHLDKKNVKEQNLLMKLMKKTSIDEMQLSPVQNAIQKAFKRHHIKDGVLSGSDYRDNKVRGGLNHTLEWYKQNKTTTEEVFVAKNFESCETPVSATEPVSHSDIPKYKPFSSYDRSGNEKESAFFDYMLNSISTGKVAFEEETDLLQTVHSKNEITRTSDDNKAYGDDSHFDNEDNNDNYTADDKNDMTDEAELTDDDDGVEENIKSNSDDETSSSVDDDFRAESECGSNESLSSVL